MEFADVVRRQRMTRPPYADRPVPLDVLDAILASGQKAPSAGFSQGFACVVLEGLDQTEPFWRITHPRNLPDQLLTTPVILLPLEHSKAYVERYQAPDKAATGLGAGEDAWPVPYWTVDTSFSTMMILLTATAHGVGAWFFGIFAGEDELLAEMGVPDGYRPIGAIALGYPADGESRSPSLRRGRRDFNDVFHRGRW